MGFAAYFDAQVRTMGGAVDNVSNNFLSYTDTEETDGGLNVVCASGLTNHSDVPASLEISLYQGKKLQEIKQLSLEPGERRLVFFESFFWQGEALRSELGSVSFEGRSRGDSLPQDNTAYAVAGQTGKIQAVLVGAGNTYLEKAYQAATGKSLTKVGAEGEQPEGAGDVRVYDAGVDGNRREEAPSLA